MQPRSLGSFENGAAQASDASLFHSASANVVPLSHAVRILAVNPTDNDDSPPQTKKDRSIAPASEVGVPETRTMSTSVTPSSAKQAVSNVEMLTEGIRARVDGLRQTGRVELHLDLSPPDLGRVRVQMVAHDQEVNVRLLVQDESARHVLTAQVESLRHRLSEVGVLLGHVDVRRDGSGSPHARREQPDELPPPSNKNAMPRRSSGANAAGGRQGINLLA
jgi:flagellar hook-length control protein FliK